MPIYEFKCKNDFCRYVFEKVERVGDHKKETECPQCGSRAVQLAPLLAVHDEHPAWINQALRDSIQDETEKPIETRSELKAAVKEKNLVDTTPTKCV